MPVLRGGNPRYRCSSRRAHRSVVVASHASSRVPAYIDLHLISRRPENKGTAWHDVHVDRKRQTHRRASTTVHPWAITPRHPQAMRAESTVLHTLDAQCTYSPVQSSLYAVQPMTAVVIVDNMAMACSMPCPGRLASPASNARVVPVSRRGFPAI